MTKNNIIACDKQRVVVAAAAAVAASIESTPLLSPLTSLPLF